MRDPTQNLFFHLYDQRRYFYRTAFTRNYHDTGFGDVPIADTVRPQVVAHQRVFRQPDVLVQNRAFQFGAAADVAIVQNHAVLHQRARVNAHIPSQYRIANHATGKDAATRNDAVDRLPAAIGVVEGKLGGRIGVAGAAQRPLPVVEI